MITSSVLLGLEVVLEEISLLLVLLSLMLTFSYFTGDVFIVERLLNFRVSTSIYGLPLLLYVLWSMLIEMRPGQDAGMFEGNKKRNNR